MPGQFQNSLAALAQIAQHEAGADGYALFRWSGDGVGLRREDAGGVPVSEDAVLESLRGSETAPVTTYRLGDSDGILALAFSGSKRREPGKILQALTSVWTAAQRTAQYSQLADELAELESRLMDSKIADRVRGVLGHPDVSAVDAISRHVESILRPLPGRRALEQLSRDLAQEVEERNLATRAKTILQSVHGMSEEQAYAHLRQTSRHSRRPLREIAAAVIEQHTAGESLAGGSSR